MPTRPPVQGAVERARSNAAAVRVYEATLIDDMPPVKDLVLRGRAALVDLGFDPDELADEEADQELRDAIPENTTGTYGYQYGRWLWWCGKTGRHHGDPYKSASAGSIRKWTKDHWYLRKPKAGEVGPQPYAYSSVKNAVYAICAIMQMFGHVSPAKNPGVKKQLRAYLKKWKKHAGYEVRQAYALPEEGSIEIARSYDWNTVGGLRNAAAFRMQRNMFCRASDVLNLQRRHLNWIEPGHQVMVYVLDPKEGTPREVPMIAVLEFEQLDADGRVVRDEDGNPVMVPNPNADAEAVVLLWKWWNAAAEQGHDAPETPLFLEVATGYPRKDGTLAGKILPKAWEYKAYLMAWKRRIRKLKFEERFGHPSISFGTHASRRGPIDEAVDEEIPLEQVAARSGHSPSSPTIHGYYNKKPHFDDRNPAVRLAKAAGRRARRGSGSAK